ncbi:MAG: hypothetical protein EOP67_55650, partial [Sphingomonas sp.]
VVGGMISATVLAIFFVPMFFIIVLRLFGHSAEVKPEDDGRHDDDRYDGGRDDDRRDGGEHGHTPAPQGA